MIRKDLKLSVKLQQNVGMYKSSPLLIEGLVNKFSRYTYYKLKLQYFVYLKTANETGS